MEIELRFMMAEKLPFQVLIRAQVDILAGFQQGLIEIENGCNIIWTCFNILC